MRGVIKKLVISDKGHGQEKISKYGFITDEAGEDRYFFHKSLINVEFEALAKGDAVIFEPALGGQEGKGLRAIQVRLDA